MATTNTKKKELPSAEMEVKELPTTEMEKKEIPVVGNPENMVMIGGNPVEIKPTKLKYQRNRTAAFYVVLDSYPTVDIVSMGAEQFGNNRDGDKSLMDWLIAATDNEKLILDNYNEMDTETVEKILEIFKRVNKIDEKAEKRKNQMGKRKEG